MLRQRVLSSIVFVPILIAAIWFENPWFSIVVAVAALLGALEFYNMVSQRGWQPLTIFGTLWTLFFIFNAYYDPSYASESTKLLVTFSLVASAVVIPLLWVVFLRPIVMSLLRKQESRHLDSRFRGKDMGKTLLSPSREKITHRSPVSSPHVFLSWAASMAGVFYIGWLLSYWVLIMNSYGRDWVFIALFSTFAVDTSAYFVGRAFGKHKMAPKVSPGKTWEGAAGGLVGGLVAVVVLSVLFDVGISYSKMVLLGFLVAVFAQVGDLVESKLKRSVGVKEAGNLIPGHGGILDRLDSIVFTGVVVYYCLRWFIG